MDFRKRLSSKRMAIGTVIVAVVIALIAIESIVFPQANTTAYPILVQRFVNNPQPSTQNFASPHQNEKEYWEARGAVIWLPWIKRAVDDAIQAGVVQPSERTLFENMILGVVGVEAGGANPFIKRPHGLPLAVSSDGLTQLIRQHRWSNENPFDPLTNLREGIRTLARYYRGYGNRWDLALMEHLTGDVTDPSKIDDAGFMNGGTYPKRVIEINRMARKLLAENDLFDDPFYFVKDADTLTRQGMALAPPWHIFDSPNLPFDWTPPPTSRAYELLSGNPTDIGYFERVANVGVRLQLGNGDNPGDAAPGPATGDASVMFEPIDGPMFEPRPATPEELAAAQVASQAPAIDGVNYAVGGFKQNAAAQPWYKVAVDAATKLTAPGGIIGPIPPTGMN